MAYTYAQIYDIASVGTARTIEETRKVYILNAAQNLIWRMYDWRWTIAKLAPFWLIPYEQEYGSPIVAIPADLERLQQANLVKILPSGPIPVRNQLKVTKELPINDLMGIPTQISLVHSTRSVRLWPRAGGGMGAPNYYVESTYKTLPTAVTSTYQTTTLPSQDHQVQMWVDAVRAMYYKVIGDPKAGEIRYSNGQMVYTGALATAMASIKEEAMNEGLDMGDPNIAPSESLLIGAGSNTYGPFPFL